MSRRAEGISITESTGRGVALSAELSLQPVQAYSIFTGHIAGNLLFSDGEETARSSAGKVERAGYRRWENDRHQRTEYPPHSSIREKKNKGLLFSNGSIGKRHRKLSLWNNYCSGVTWLCVCNVCVYFFLCFIFLLRYNGGWDWTQGLDFLNTIFFWSWRARFVSIDGNSNLSLVNLHVPILFPEMKWHWIFWRKVWHKT